VVFVKIIQQHELKWLTHFSLTPTVLQPTYLLIFVSSASPLKVCRLMSRLPVLIGANIMLI